LAALFIEDFVHESMSRSRFILVPLFFLLVGGVTGGYLFNDSRPRSFLSLNQCQNCLSSKDLAGLLSSAGIQKFPGFIPFVAVKTDKTIAIKNPLPEARVDYIIIPRKDIKNIGQISREDAPYLLDVYAVAQDIIRKEKVSHYRFYTNGPGFQDVTYLHFHLISK
jgi:hypothetical protein